MMTIRGKFNQNNPLFIPFIMAGHPTINTSLHGLIALSKAGADIIELGVPFSDPIADGPINQIAAEIALDNGINLEDCFTLIQQFRAKGFATPIILFSYYNPILKMGLKTFAEQAKAAGINAVLVVDLPIGESTDLRAALSAHQLEFILLASPTTQAERIHAYLKLRPAFIYYISRLGVTGIQDHLSLDLEKEIRQLKQRISDIPICVGFGITLPSQAKTVAQFADGVIVGSALVQCLGKGDLNEFSNLARNFVLAIKPI